MPRIDRLLVTCEHGGARVPRRYAWLFSGASRALAGHRGSDPGALAVARSLSRALGCPLHASTVTRLLVDLNRSPHHPRIFSEWSRRLDSDERAALLQRHYWPHRLGVERAVAGPAARGLRTLHVAVHSFVPVLGGEVREADVGLLYDPRRSGERAFCAHWREELRARAPGLRVRRNHPYRGSADGLTTYLRGRLPGRHYLGVELELNQARLRARGSARRRLVAALGASLASLSSRPVRRP